jgi:O-antigen ligase
MHFFSPQPRTTSPLHLGLGFTLFILLTWSAFDYGGRYLHVQAFAQALTGGLLLLSLSRPLLTPVPPFFKTWGCWGLVLTLSFAFSGNRLASLEEILRWLMYAGIFWSAYTYSQSPRQRSWLTTAILLIGTAICSLGWLTAEAGLVVSSFHRTNDLAGYLLLLLPFGLQVTLTSQGWLRTLGTLSSLLFLASLIATNSRSSWASAAVSLGVLVWLNRKVLTPSLWRWMLSLLAIGSSLGLLLFAPKVFPRLMTLFSITQENATAWRGALLESAWKIFIQYPFTGSGPNTFGSAIRSVQTTPGYYSIDPHNFYLLLLSEVGIFGLFGFLWLIYQILSGISHQEQPLKAGILASLSACLLHIAFDIEWGVSAIPILFFTLAGIGLSPRSSAIQELSPQQTHLWKLVRLGMGLTLLILPALNLFSSRAYQDAAILVENKDYLAARTPLQQAMRLAPWPSARHYRTLAEIECAQKQAQACLSAALKAVPLDRYNNESLHIASQALHLSGDRQGALKLLEQAVLLNPVRHPSDYTRVGDYYQFIHKDNAFALTWYQRGAALFTDKALRRYESYTVGDRYESYTLLKRIATLADVMGNSTLRRETNVQAITRLAQEPVSPKLSPAIATPVVSLNSYWKAFIQWQNTPATFPHRLPATTPEAPIPYPLKQSKIQNNSLEILEARRSFSDATLTYQIALRNTTGKIETLRIKDHFQLGEEGWYIVLREPA